MHELTIGFATHTDFDGIYFTIQSLRLNDPEILSKSEIVIIDNSPQTKHSEHIKGLCNNIAGHVADVKYVEMTEPVGTSPTRNRIFQEGTGRRRLVMDSHVLLAPGALRSLMEYYEKYPDCKDILSGPMLYDNLVGTSTQFDNNWRSQMLGTWGSAWQCNCSPTDGVRFAMDEDPQTRMIRCFSLTMDKRPVTGCPNCGINIPIVPWHGHQNLLTNYHRLGSSPIDIPFEIPGQGLGLFSCSGDAWLGFHPLATGFGGEELCIHEAYRQIGHKAICIPGLKWMHRFARPGGTPYPVTLFHKVRNYLLWFKQLGWDAKAIYEHFVRGSTPIPDNSQTMDPGTWARLSADPENITSESQCATCGQKSPPTPSTQFKSMDEIFNTLKIIPRDLDQHMPRLRELAESVKHITEFSARRESTIAFLAAKPETLVSYNSEIDGAVLAARAFVSNYTETSGTNDGNSDKVSHIAETDLLFIDTEHTYTRLKRELTKFAGSVKRYVVLHDTDLFGQVGDDGSKPGLLAAIREFVTANPKWSVLSMTPDQHGLTVLGCDPRDKQPLPGWIEQAANFSKAMVKMTAAGFEQVTDEQFKERMEICALCPIRNGDRCSDCGCYLSARASQKVMDCPYSKWPNLTILESKSDVKPN